MESYKFLWTTRDSLFRSLQISVIVTVIGVSANVMLTILYAYPLSRKDLPGRNAISLFLFFTMLFNGGMVPWFIVCRNMLHLTDSILALILPYLANAWFIFLVRNYYSCLLYTSRCV